MFRRPFPLALASVLAASAPLVAEPEPAAPPAGEIRDTIQVTATRVPEDVLDVPASVTVVSAEELAARGVRDLAGALALVAGVSIAPGGDGGPASSVPELMGLREFDAFLLVVDGVPWGGAFNPALATLDLTGVERIEVLRGSAPVLYGATSFVGVIHVLHFAPGGGERAVDLGGGSYDTFLGRVTVPLPGASWQQSIVANAETRGFAPDRSGVDRAHFLAEPGEIGGQNGWRNEWCGHSRRGSFAWRLDTASGGYKNANGCFPHAKPAAGAACDERCDIFCEGSRPVGNSAGGKLPENTEIKGDRRRLRVNSVCIQRPNRICRVKQ